MSRISPLLRRQIDTAAYELIAVAEKLQSTLPTLAQIYKALGQGIDSSHYKKNEGELYLGFDFPAGCDITVTGNATEMMSGPVRISFTMRE